ncbi:MAG: 2-keto-4-pentenoate hydratase [Nocardioides sp.]|uniref:2-keto-4-pentenoate hydratase n=1 Tax=Nocardioides sp. TaxID=35761 RepID=UPI0026156FC0|nr:fumarylacetoacetate hydrolase family protein [Nocardioides sp.]
MTPGEAAATLRAARVEGRTLEPFTDEHPGLDEAWGYAVQRLDLRARLGAGEQPIGAKLGLTSEAKQQRMGVRRPVVGFLTDAMLLSEGPVDTRRWVQPRVEPEVAFLTGRRIDRALGPTEAASYVGGVGVAAEVLDSRWTGYRFRLADVLADATSAAGFVLGSGVHDLATVGDLAALRGEVRVDGEVVERATGAAVLGDPLRALVLLSEHLAAHEEVLPEGSWVLAGAFTDAVPLVAGRRYELEVETLGTIRLDAC